MNIKKMVNKFSKDQSAKQMNDWAGESMNRTIKDMPNMMRAKIMRSALGSKPVKLPTLGK